MTHNLEKRLKHDVDIARNAMQASLLQAGLLLALLALLVCAAVLVLGQ